MKWIALLVCGTIVLIGGIFELLLEHIFSKRKRPTDHANSKYDFGFEIFVSLRKSLRVLWISFFFLPSIVAFVAIILDMEIGSLPIIEYGYAFWAIASALFLAILAFTPSTQRLCFNKDYKAGKVIRKALALALILLLTGIIAIFLDQLKGSDTFFQSTSLLLCQKSFNQTHTLAHRPKRTLLSPFSVDFSSKIGYNTPGLPPLGAEDLPAVFLAGIAENKREISQPSRNLVVAFSSDFFVYSGASLLRITVCPSSWPPAPTPINHSSAVLCPLSF
jgi:hypothetical protein